MLLRLFFPPVFKGRRLYSEKILSISIEYGVVRAVVLKQGIGRPVVEKMMEKEFSLFSKMGKRFGFDKDSLTAALSYVLGAKPQSYDVVRVVVPGDLSIVKNLVLPFVDVDKVKLIVEYEAEPLLPFQQGEFSLGFLKVGQQSESESNILISAMKTVDLNKTSECLQGVGLGSVQNLLVDTIVNFSLITNVPDYQDLDHYTAFVDLRPSSTTVGFVLGGQLKLVKNIELDLSDLISNFASQHNLDEEKLFESLRSVGSESFTDDSIALGFKQAFETLFDSIILSLDALSLRSSSKVGRFVIFDKSRFISDFDLICQKRLGIQCEYFSSVAWSKAKNVKNKETNDPDKITKFITALGAADLPEKFQTFNLGSNVLEHPEKKVISRQIVALLSLLTIFCLVFVSRGMFKVSRLAAELEVREKKVVAKLKGDLPKDLRFSKNARLKRVVNDAQAFVQQRNKNLLPFSQNVPDPLVVLFELTRLMDRSRFGVKVSELFFAPDPNSIGNYLVTITGDFDLTKSSSQRNTFEELINVLRSSQRLVLLDPVSQEPDKDEAIKFSLSLRVKSEAN